MAIQTRSQPYRDGDAQLTGFFAWDGEGSDRRPGLLVVHGGAGLDDHARRQAVRLAERGFVTFACDLYGEGVAGDRQRVMARIAELRGDRATLCRRLQAGLAELVSHPRVDGRLAAVGYCLGGLTVLELARAGVDIAGVVSVHGSLETIAKAERGVIKAKILVCHGALDPHVPVAQVTGFVEEMNAALADWQLVVYGGAMHGFTHEGSTPLPGVAFHAPSDARSFEAMQHFFAELFGAGGAS